MIYIDKNALKCVLKSCVLYFISILKGSIYPDIDAHRGLLSANNLWACSQSKVFSLWSLNSHRIHSLPGGKVLSDSVIPYCFQVYCLFIYDAFLVPLSCSGDSPGGGRWLWLSWVFTRQPGQSKVSPLGVPSSHRAGPLPSLSSIPEPDIKYICNITHFCTHTTII